MLKHEKGGKEQRCRSYGAKKCEEIRTQSKSRFSFNRNSREYRLRKTQLPY